MLTLLKFELKKNWQKNYLFAVFFLAVLVVCGAFYMNHQKAVKYEEKYTASLEEEIQLYKNKLLELDEVEELPQPGPRKKELVELYESLLGDERKKLDFIQSRNHSSYAEWFGTKAFDTVHGGDGFMYPAFEDGHVMGTNVYMISAEEMEWIKEHKVQPMYPLNILVTEFDRQIMQPRTLTAWEKMNERHYDTALYFVWYLLENHLVTIMMAVLVILFAGFLRSEKQNKKNHLDFLYTQTVKPGPLFIAKYVSNVFWALLLTTSVVGVLIAFSSFISGLGSWEYPVLTYIFQSDISPVEPKFIALGSFLFQNLILFVLAVLFILALSQFVGLFVPNEFLAVFTTLILLAGGTQLPVNRWNPFLYMDTANIVRGIYKFQTSLDVYSYQNGVLTLSIGTVLLLGAGYALFAGREKAATNRIAVQ